MALPMGSAELGLPRSAAAPAAHKDAVPGRQVKFSLGIIDFNFFAIFFVNHDTWAVALLGAFLALWI